MLKCKIAQPTCGIIYVKIKWLEMPNLHKVIKCWMKDESCLQVPYYVANPVATEAYACFELQWKAAESVKSFLITNTKCVWFRQAKLWCKDVNKKIRIVRLIVQYDVFLLFNCVLKCFFSTFWRM